MHHDDAIGGLFDLFASGVAHRNPVAIAVFALWVWLTVRIVVRVLSPRPRGTSYLPRGGCTRASSYLTQPARPRPVSPPTPARPSGHPDYCPCKYCRPVREAEEAAAARLPEPSQDLEPVETGCRHEAGVATVRDRYGTLLRYACANGRCDAVWGPGTQFPPGTVILDPEEG